MLPTTLIAKVAKQHTRKKRAMLCRQQSQRTITLSKLQISSTLKTQETPCRWPRPSRHTTKIFSSNMTAGLEIRMSLWCLAIQWPIQQLCSCLYCRKMKRNSKLSTWNQGQASSLIKSIPLRAWMTLHSSNNGEAHGRLKTTVKFQPARRRWKTFNSSEKGLNHLFSKKGNRPICPWLVRAIHPQAIFTSKTVQVSKLRATFPETVPHR